MTDTDKYSSLNLFQIYNNGIKSWTLGSFSLSLTLGHNIARVFDLGKFDLQSLTFVSKAKTLFIEWGTTGCFTLIGSGLTRKSEL